ncbi:MAG: alpha/beta hydrolase family protein [Alicyclobacillus macrosporangiidus]|uniref:dienelactone hydrolase family protein n=1 Tax=Alicyclobacillus macrosporangiidus TaxID=392015 RepID=UPI0026EA27F4|nr:alpha/beta hydrolase family protein [Alicyclobacillus macrosporangiidus]MCL6597190.1 alpha/beta hydrolase family protein [Alicyclobacillus macrosporangiidus]
MSVTHAEEILQRIYEDSANRRTARLNAEGGLHRRRRQLIRLLGVRGLQGFNDALPSSPLAPALLAVETAEDLRLEWIEYTTYPGVRTCACVLTPPQGPGPRPAVLACPGHGRGIADAIGRPLPPELARPSAPSLAGPPVPQEGGIHRHFAIELARRGMIVIVPEVLGLGVRRLADDDADDPAGRRSSCYRIATHLLMHGQTLAGFRTYEAMRALDYLRTRADVDAHRIGVFGFSGGGLIAMLTAILDERIRAVVLSGYASTFRGSVLAAPHCVDNYIPGLLEWGEMPDWIGLIAPRPLFLETGVDDTVFPLPPALDAAAAVRARYEALGAPDAIATDVFPGGHEISGRRSFDWLARQLHAAGMA